MTIKESLNDLEMLAFNNLRAEECKAIEEYWLVRNTLSSKSRDFVNGVVRREVSFVSKHPVGSCAIILALMAASALIGYVS